MRITRNRPVLSAHFGFEMNDAGNYQAQENSRGECACDSDDKYEIENDPDQCDTQLLVFAFIEGN